MQKIRGIRGIMLQLSGFYCIYIGTIRGTSSVFGCRAISDNRNKTIQKVTRRKEEHRSQCLPESRIVIPVLG